MEYHYNNPTLVEIFSEISLGKDSLPAEKLVEAATQIKEALGFQTVELDQKLIFAIQQDKGQQQIGPAPRLRCWNVDKTCLVQIAKDQIIVNQVGQYLGWNKYRGLLEASLKEIGIILPSIEYRSVSMNTIDKINVPKENYSFEQYLNAGGPVLPAIYKGIKESCDITLGMGFIEKDGYNKSLHLTVRIGEAEAEIQFTAKIHKLFSGSGSMVDLFETLHSESLAFFEDIISQKTRDQVMGGKK